MVGASVERSAASPPHLSWFGVPPGHAERIKLSWLIHLQWGAIVGQFLTIISACGILGLSLLWAPLFALIGLEIAVNIALEISLRRAKRIRQHVIASAMLFDALAMTALLAFSGGPWNPFASMYLVNVALAAVLLDPFWAWVMLGAGLAMYSGLFALAQAGLITVWAIDRQQMMSLHLQGMWVAFVLSATFIVYIVQRVQMALTGAQEALASERSLSARKDKVASLATLAAGAAHELSTPLSTIAVVVKELQRQAERSGASEEGVQDLSLIREQVGRCRDILHQMAAQAGENAGEPIVSVLLSSWVNTTLEYLPDQARVQLESEVALDAYAVAGPARALSRGLRSLLKNALQASLPDAHVHLRVSVDRGVAQLRVIDHGCGMPAEVLKRAGEPFFTTKVPGDGMGLGLFLTRAIAEQLGGKLELRSILGAGTTATLEIPSFPSGGAKHDDDVVLQR